MERGELVAKALCQTKSGFRARKVDEQKSQPQANGASGRWAGRGCQNGTCATLRRAVLAHVP
jgi:hypothetical protein